MTLEKHHLEQLNKGAISHEVIAERGYRSVTNKAELASLGFGSNQQRVPALLPSTKAGVGGTYRPGRAVSFSGALPRWSAEAVLPPDTSRH